MSSDIGLRMTTASERASSAGMRSRSTRSGGAKLHPSASERPAPASASSMRRRRRWAGASTPVAPRREGSVAGSFSRPHRRATSSTRSTSRVHVAAPEGRHRDVEPVVGVRDLHLQRAQDLRRVAARDGGAEQPLRPRVAQPDRRRVRPRPAHVHRAAAQPRAGQLEHELGGQDLAVHALLGLQLLLEPAGGLRAQAEPRRRPLDVRPVPGGRLHQHAPRRRADLGALAAHDPGDRRRPVVVGDDDHVLVHHAIDVVERGEHLARLRAPHDEMAAGHEVEVERVHRLAGGQHHVVRDVDDVVDRPHAGRGEPRLEPLRRRADVDVLEQPRGEARAQVGDLHLDLHAGHLAGRARIVAPGRRRQRRPAERVHLARDAVDRQAVGPVRRDLQLEHVGGDRQHVGERRADDQSGVEHHDPVVVGADGHLVLGQDHPVGLDAAELRALELRPVGHDRARAGHRHDLPGRHVRRAAHDLPRFALPHVDHADGQPVRVGMAVGAEHAADHEVLEAADAVPEQRLDLGAGHGQPVLELREAQPGIAVVVQPDQRDPHPNCSRKRRSLS